VVAECPAVAAWAACTKSQPADSLASTVIPSVARNLLLPLILNERYKGRLGATHRDALFITNDRNGVSNDCG
jgi:hypothetical protein